MLKSYFIFLCLAFSCHSFSTAKTCLDHVIILEDRSLSMAPHKSIAQGLLREVDHFTRGRIPTRHFIFAEDLQKAVDKIDYKTPYCSRCGSHLEEVFAETVKYLQKDAVGQKKALILITDGEYPRYDFTSLLSHEEIYIYYPAFNRFQNSADAYYDEFQYHPSNEQKKMYERVQKLSRLLSQSSFINQHEILEILKKKYSCKFQEV